MGFFSAVNKLKKLTCSRIMASWHLPVVFENARLLLGSYNATRTTFQQKTPTAMSVYTASTTAPVNIAVCDNQLYMRMTF